MLSRWISLALWIWFASAPAMAQAENASLREALEVGLGRPFINMNHLIFLMMSGLVAFCVSKRLLDLAVLMLGTWLGIASFFVWGAIPGALLLAGLGNLLLLLILWNAERTQRFAGLAMGLSALGHGQIYAQFLSGPLALEGQLVFAGAVTLSQIVIAVLWGYFMRRVALKAESTYDGLEHLLTAVAAGVALVFIYRGFAAFFPA